tara:strand:+ start:178 stop:555 length:378 start_codon:yes stop_codon:yes gene_type:complete
MFKNIFINIITSSLFGLILFFLLLTPVIANEKSQPKDKWFAIDKVQHFSYSCLVSLGTQYVLVNKMGKSETSALPISLGISFTAGITKEIQDSKSKNGFFSRKDLVANTMGIIFSVIIISLPSSN